MCVRACPVCDFVFLLETNLEKRNYFFLYLSLICATKADYISYMEQTKIMLMLVKSPFAELAPTRQYLLPSSFEELFEVLIKLGVSISAHTIRIR